MPPRLRCDNRLGMLVGAPRGCRSKGAEPTKTIQSVKTAIEGAGMLCSTERRFETDFSTGRTSRQAGMTLKIDTQTLGDRIVVRLTGNLGVEHLAEVRAQVGAAGGRVAIDVGELALISVEGVRLLNACEDDGVAILNTSPYMSKWMALERAAEPDQT